MTRVSIWLLAVLLAVGAPSAHAQGDSYTLNGTEYVRMEDGWYSVTGDTPLYVYPEGLSARFDSTLTGAQVAALVESLGSASVALTPHRVYDIRLPGFVDNVPWAVALSELSRVEHVELWREIVFMDPDLPNDNCFGRQWYLHNTGEVLGNPDPTEDADIDAPEAWELITGSPDIVVAILDSGVDRHHEDLSIWENTDDELGDMNDDDCPGVCGIDDDGDAWEDAESDTTDGIDNDGDGLIDETGVDLRDEQVMLADYDNDDVNLAGPDGEVWTSDDDEDDLLLARKDDDENGYADDTWGWDFTEGDRDPDVGEGDLPHGTRVAGPCCAMTHSNSVGIAGVAGGWGASEGCPVMNLRCAYGGSEARKAVLYATENGASVANMSWGTGYDLFLKDALDEAYSRGTVLVAAADDPGSYPARWGNVIGVGGSDWHDAGHEDCRATLYAPAWADPGEDESYVVTATIVNQGNLSCLDLHNNYRHYSTGGLGPEGTSYAAPQVAGAAALLRSMSPSLEPSEVCSLLVRGAENIGVATSCGNRIMWRLNVRGALDELCSWVDPERSEVSTEAVPDDSCLVLCPAGDLDALLVNITVKNRCGQPMAGIPADDIKVSLLRNAIHNFRLCCGDSQSELTASDPTDANGFTRVVIAHGAGLDPDVGIRVSVYGVELTDQPRADLRSVAYTGFCTVPVPNPKDVPDLDCDGVPGDSDDVALVELHAGHTCPTRGAGGDSPGDGKSAESSALSYRLFQNAPNPFSGATSVIWTLPERLWVKVGIYDAAGRLVSSLADGELDAGRYVERWDGMDDSGRQVASGTYFCQVESSAGILRIKATLLR